MALSSSQKILIVRSFRFDITSIPSLGKYHPLSLPFNTKASRVTLLMFLLCGKSPQQTFKKLKNQFHEN
jgi:hypothetical protein